MTPEQVQSYYKVKFLPTRPFPQTFEGPDRTLLYGYDFDRVTWHLYLANNVIHWHTYDGLTGETIPMSSIGQWASFLLLKRVYPEPTDNDFVLFLKDNGITLSITTFGSVGVPQGPPPFHGRVL